MKLKGISFFEQHVEKIFAAIIFLAMLIILAWQFLASPAAIKVGTREVPLSEAWGAVAEDARRVQANLDSSRPPEFEGAGSATQEIVKFNDTYRGPLAPSRTLAIAIGETAKIGDVGSDAVHNVAPIAALTVPAPSSPFGSAHLTLVAPFEAERDPAVAAVLPPAMPFDKAGVSVEATFDGTALLDVLTLDPDGADGPIRAMPRHWWDGSIQILDVLMEREELGPDGKWMGLTTIAPLPGRFSLREDLAQPFDGAAQLKERARTATEYAEYVRRPAYYASAIGEKWMSPADFREMEDRLAAQAGVADDATRVRRQIAGKNADLERAQQELAALGGGGRAPGVPPRPSPPPGGGGGGGKPGGGGGGGGGGGDRGQPAQDPNEQKRRGLERRIEQLNREITQLIGRLRDMGEDVSMYAPLDPAQAPEGQPTAAGATEAALLDNPAVRIWAHDVFVQRGKTYRYRLSVVLNNPMFGQGNVMVPEQQDWAKAATVRSAPSEWSEPIRVDDETYFFITSANPVTSLNRTAGARAEMFIFKWGRWRKGDAQLEPGDRLRAEIKYPDVSVVLAQNPQDPAAAQPAPGVPQPPQAPAAPGGGRLPGQPPPQSPPPNPSERDNRVPGGRDPAPPPGGGRPGQQGDAPRPVALPQLTERVAVDAIFLSVAAAQAIESAGSTRSGMVAYLRDQRGEVVPRYPDAEKSSVILARLERSVTQGAADVQANEPRPEGQPPRPLPGPREAPPPSDSGGGGGGGGA